MERLIASRAELLDALDRHRAATAAAEERQGLLSKRHGSKFVQAGVKKGEEGEGGGASNHDQDHDREDPAAGAAGDESAEDEVDEQSADDADGDAQPEGGPTGGKVGGRSDDGPPGYDTGIGGRRVIPLTLNRRSFFPRDWRHNDGFCPVLSRRNPKLGHLKNCSMAARREPHVGELASEISIKGFLQRRDDTIKPDLLTKEEDRRQRGDHRAESTDPSKSGPHRLNIHFRPDLVGHLPHKDRRFRFNSCAVVGNSGSLEGSGLGPSIDRRDAVIRMNMAPVEGYERDVGSRTTFDFINQQHTKTLVPGVHSGGKDPNSRHGGKRDSTVVVFESHSPFARYHLYAPLLKKAAAARGAAYKDKEKASADAQGEGVEGNFSSSSSGAGAAGSSDIMILSPEVVAHAFKLWGQLTAAVQVGSDVAGFTSKSFLHKPMTGWFGFVFALQVCDHVHLYGLSPYSSSYAGFKYHYYDAVRGVLRHHSFDLAYEMLRQVAHWPCSGVKVSLHDEPSGTLNAADRERARGENEAEAETRGEGGGESSHRGGEAEDGRRRRRRR